MRARLGWRGPIVCVPNGVCTPAPGGVRAVPVGVRAAPVGVRTAPAGARTLPAGRRRHPTPRLVAVGRLVRHKRLEHVVGLADELAGLYPDLDLHVIGRGPDQRRVRAAAARSAHPDRVTVHGYLPAAERDALLGTAWLHVCASQGEGWSLSALEAAAWGVPTLAYDVEGLRDAVRHRETGWLVADPGDGRRGHGRGRGSGRRGGCGTAAGRGPAGRGRGEGAVGARRPGPGRADRGRLPGLGRTLPVDPLGRLDRGAHRGRTRSTTTQFAVSTSRTPGTRTTQCAHRGW